MKLKKPLIKYKDIIDKKMVLFFSGGYDSTSVLLTMLSNGCRNIECVYIKIPNNKHKAKIEIKRCKKILKIIKKDYKIKIPFNIITSMLIPCGNTCSYAQPFLFLSSYLPMEYDDTDFLLFGYHRVSDIWHCYDSFEKSYKNLSILLRCDRYYKAGILWSPYEFFYKKDIINHLKKYKKIFKLCWTCEFPTKNNKPCGKCKPCRTIKQYI